MIKNLKTALGSIRFVFKGKLTISSLESSGWEYTQYNNSQYFNFNLKKGSVLYDRFSSVQLFIDSYDSKNNIASATLKLKHTNSMKVITFSVYDWYTLDKILTLTQNFNTKRSYK